MRLDLHRFDLRCHIYRMSGGLEERKINASLRDVRALRWSRIPVVGCTKGDA